MASLKRVLRQQLLREAEGYLELATLFADRWPLGQEARERLVRRALQVLNRLRRSAALRSRVNYLRGQAFLILERYRHAIRALRASADEDGENIHVWLALGWCYKRVGRLDLAIQSLEEAIEIDPDVAVIHYNLACYWSLANNPKLAVAYLSAAFDLEPDFRNLVASEPDFDNIRHHPDFLALTSVIV